jgi:predicted site-specific integrase-resolvase
MPPTAAEVQAKLDAGAWLKSGALAILFGVDRSTVDDWIGKGLLGYRRTVGGHRECDPADVRKLLAERNQIHRGNEGREQ